MSKPGSSWQKPGTSWLQPRRRPELLGCTRKFEKSSTRNRNRNLIPGRLLVPDRKFRFRSQPSRKYPCSQCEYQATTKDSLTKPNQSIHEGKKYRCSQCNSVFTMKGSLTIHQQSMHEGKKYPCSQCNSQFSQKANLYTHEQSAHKEKKWIQYLAG